MADTTKYIERAETEVKRRNFDMAMDLYQEILQIDPDCGAARSGLRRAALKKLEKRYPSALTTGVLNLPVSLMLGIAGLFKAHNWTVGLCESALRRDPRNAKLNQRLGRSLLALGWMDSALAAFRVVTEFDKQNIEALKTLGRLLYDSKQMEEALQCFERALKINPRDQEANKMRKNLAAEGAIQRGGYEKARTARDLAKSQRQLQEAERAQRIVRTSEDLGEAIEELSAELEQNPEDTAVMVRLASLQARNQQMDEAVDLLVRASKVQPDDAEVLERLGDVRMRRLELAIEAADQETGEDDEGGAEDRLRRLRRDLLNLKGEEYRRRVDLHPTDLALRFRLGQTLLEDGATDEAIEQFQQAVKDPRHRVAALQLLGRAFSKKGMLDLAVKQLGQAADTIGTMSAQKKEILYELARVREQAGSQESALATYKEIYEADISYRDVGSRIEELSSGESRQEN